MASIKQNTLLGFEEYLSRELLSVKRQELVNGEVFVMTGASASHK